MTVDKEELLLEALFSDEVIELPQQQRFRAAMRIAGYAEGYHSTKLKKRLAEKIKTSTEEFIAQNAPNAAITIVNSMEYSDKGTRDRLSAAKEILSITGISKPEKIEVNVPNPIVFLPKKDPHDED